jgi:predicted permease
MHDDLRHALRALRKAPGFTTVAVLTLAFGIGVNANLFSMVSAFFLQPLPVKNGQDLVLVLQRSDAWKLPHGHSFPDYLDYREGTSAFTELVAYMPTPVHLGAPGQTPERTWIELVTPNYFSLAEAGAALGQVFRAEAGRTKSAEPTVVLSHRYWQRRFGGDPSIVGRTITLNGRAFTVIGVAAASFPGLSWAMAVSAFVPCGAASALLEGGDELLESRGAPAWRLMGRLRPGTTLAQARSEVEVVGRRLAASFPSEHKGAQLVVIRETSARPDPTFADFMPLLAAVFAAMVGLVLFIACANVANLMFSRSLVRQRELVMRAALGASRWRLVRLQVVESLALALMAGALGLLLARWAGQALAGFTPPGDIPINTDHPWDWRVYLFTFLISAAAGVTTGLWPALQASRFGLSEALKEGGAGRFSPSRHPFRNLLVVGQVTMSLVVLVCAGLFLHSLQRVKDLALGFRTDNLLMMSLDLGLQGYSDERGRRFLDQLLDRARSLPGVRSATLVLHVPFDYGVQITDVGIDGDIPGSRDGYVATSFNVVGEDYLAAAGVALLQGRGFEESDHPRGRRVAIVNLTMARTLWPGREAVGQRLRLGRNGDWIEVVGVAADGKYVMMAEEPRAYFYLPLAQHYRSPITLMVRTATEPGPLVKPLQGVLNDLDPDLPVFNVRTMERHLRDSAFGLMPLRMGATLAGLQGLIALLLAVMGLYAVVSYAVSQRTHEIGIRMALGARRRGVLRLVLREGMRLAVIGVLIGLVAAVGMGFALSRVLYGLKPIDLGVFAGVTTLLLAVAALACYLPARRATRVDPMVALRYE